MVHPLHLLHFGLILLLLGGTGSGWAILHAEPVELFVDWTRSAGVLRPLHGLNKGPLVAGGLLDLTEPLAALRPPTLRLHDCHWPNPDVVDIHAVFPDFRADPSLPASYDFKRTDAYLAAVRQTGAEIIYRLGESIEHTPDKRFVHPPADPEKWAAICVGIVRHYNEGWADGFRHGIRYWEIWNEPENRPAMWTGTDEDYFRLYRVTAQALRRLDPALKVGGPAVGDSGRFVGDELHPSAFVTRFLERCRQEALPLDFFSWHGYTADPAEFTRRARAIRGLLDGFGFRQTLSHLNEWNYLPGNTWEPLSRASPAPVRQRFYETMAGAAGAAFVTTVLLELQDAPVDGANLFHGEIGAFGLFNEYGVPQKNYHVLRAFRTLLDTPERVPVRGAVPGKVALAAGLNVDRTRAGVLVSSFNHPERELRLDLGALPWSGPTVAGIRIVDATHDGEIARRETNAPGSSSLRLRLPAPGVVLIELQPALAAP